MNNINKIKGIGPKKAEILLTELGIETVEDLLYYIPRKYIDRSKLKQIDTCENEDIVTIIGTITKIVLTGSKRKFLKLTVSDESGILEVLFFGGANYLKKKFAQGDEVLFSGKIKKGYLPQMIQPEFDFAEIGEDKNINTGRIIPLYRSSETLKKAGFDSRGFRKVIKYSIDNFLKTVHDKIPENLNNKFDLIPLKDALYKIHFPESLNDTELARKRLAFNEIFFFQYYLSLSKEWLKNRSSKTLNKINFELYENFINSLPFKLTNDQKKSIKEITSDILSTHPMNRLLQGDVGSGKTVVSMAASITAILNGFQVAIMAPTEVLAKQHFENFISLMPNSLSTISLTGRLKGKKREDLLYNLSTGKIDIIIGTHAIIEDDIIFKNLGLIIIDEQHKFGVNQRAKLRAKGNETDLLVMTATPIPRSLSLTTFGDLDISSIKEKPANRIPIKTLSFSNEKISGVYNSMEKYIKEGRQIYFVLPLIEESEKIDLKSAIERYEELSTSVFKQRNVGLLHGKLKNKEKNEIMKSFKNKEIDILVSTTVIEVGVDIPNATVMVIEHPERFGLSQLHQLRGRVGRGEHQSFCILLHPNKISQTAKKRIETMVKYDDGFLISEMDLQLRGAGELIGNRQHGHSSEFEFVDLTIDENLIIEVKDIVDDLVSDIKNIDLAYSEIHENKFSQIFWGIRKKKVLSILA